MMQLCGYFVCLLCVAVGNLIASEPEILFLSYPRSGAYWSLYCLNHVLNREVIYNRGIDEERISQHSGGPSDAADDFNGYIYGAHHPNGLWIKKDGEKHDILIVMVRNYRECMLRHLGSVENVNYYLEVESIYSWFDHHGSRNRAFLNHKDHYINVLRCYEFWDPSKRYMIFLEDFLKDPMPILIDIMQMLGVMPAEDTWHFFDYLEDHKRNCMKLYEAKGGSQSKGRDMLYHSKRVGLHGCKKIDGSMEGLFPHYFNKYLSRYKIKSLDIESSSSGTENVEF